MVKFFTTPTKFQLKIKEGMHIEWLKPSLNKQVKTLHHIYIYEDLNSHLLTLTQLAEESTALTVCPVGLT